METRDKGIVLFLMGIIALLITGMCVMEGWTDEKTYEFEDVDEFKLDSGGTLYINSTHINDVDKINYSEGNLKAYTSIEDSLLLGRFILVFIATCIGIVIGLVIISCPY